MSILTIYEFLPVQNIESKRARTCKFLITEEDESYTIGKGT